MKKILTNFELSSGIEFVLNTFLYVIGRQITITSDAPDRSLCDFEKRMHAQDVHEYFGLGLHLIVSPLRITKK
jgi:hypothetical protein